MFFNAVGLSVAVVLLLIVAAYLKGRKPKHLPPGPKSWPFIGNLPIILNNKSIHKTFAALKDTYGSVFSLQLGWRPVVVISDVEQIKELLVKQADKFSHRPATMLYQLRGLDRGVAGSHGPLWKASRKMTITTLRDFGVGKSSIEAKVQEEAQAVVEEFAKAEGKPFTLHQTFAKATSNVICSVLFEKRYDYDEPEFVNVIKCLDIQFEIGTQANPFIMLPILLPLLPLNRRFSKVRKMEQEFDKFLKSQIKSHRDTYQPGTIRDFVDIYLEEEMNEKGKNLYNDENIFRTIIDLFLAGTETTSTTLKWAMLYMLKHPQIQHRCRQDILNVIGPDRTPALTDREKLPYIEATLCEVQRIGNIAPHALFHATNGTVRLNENTVLPDQTIVIPDLYSVHMNPDLWDEPELFKPERFISVEEKVVRPKHFMPFSVGRRACPGENLARTELFIFFTSLLQKYQFTVPDDTKLPDIEDATFGITLCPPAFNVIAKSS